MIFYAPRNFKKSAYIFSKYTPRDLILLTTVLVVSFAAILIAALFTPKVVALFIVVLACFICLGTFILVLPIPNHHNVLEFIFTYLHFHSKQKKYLWYGIDYHNYEELEDK